MSHFQHRQNGLNGCGTGAAACEALRDLGMSPELGERPVRGYRGQSRARRIGPCQSEGGDKSVSAGTKQSGSYGAGDLTCDLWKQPVPVDAFLSHQRYALRTILAASHVRERFPGLKWNSRSTTDAAIELCARWDS